MKRKRKSIVIEKNGELKKLMAVEGGKAHIMVFTRKTTAPGAGKPILGELQPLARKLGLKVERSRSKHPDFVGKVYLYYKDPAKKPETWDQTKPLTIEDAKEIVKREAKKKGYL